MNKLPAGIVAGVAILGGVTAFALTYPGTGPGEGGIDAAPGNAILDRTAAAYANAAGLTDVMRLEFTAANGQKEVVEVPYALGAGTDSSIGMPALSAVALGTTLYLVRDDIADKYAELTLKGDMTSTLDSIFPGGSSLPVAFDMRAGRGTPRYLASLGLDALRRPRLSGYEKIEDGTPHGVHKLALAAENGHGSVQIDGKTHLLRQLSVEAQMTDDPESKLNVRVTFTPKVHASAEGLVTFNAGNRRKVDSFSALQPTKAAVGDVAPDFTLKTLDGESVTLSDLRGSVVVVDFWATWCRPCIMGLPLLNDFHKWATESGRPIAVYAVDTFESGTPEAVANKAATFWESQKFSMPTLLDPGNAAVSKFGIQSIPTTYVIDPNGVIAKIHQGFDPNMAANLKTEVLEVLAD